MRDLRTTTNGTTLAQVIRRQTPVLVVCPLKFCNQKAGWEPRNSYEPNNSRSNQELKKLRAPNLV